MLLIRRLSFSSIFLCLLSAIGWLIVPLVFQWYLKYIMENKGGFLLSLQGFILIGIVGIVALVEYWRFCLFLKIKPFYGQNQSIGSKLSQDRLWSMELPNFMSNLILILGSLTVLLFRDFRVCLIVMVWFILSYFIQDKIGKQLQTIAICFRDCGDNNDRAMEQQSKMLKWQVLGNCSSSILKMSGQVFIYSVLFIVMVNNNSSEDVSKALPVVLANLEYVGISLGGLQAMASSFPRLKELLVYLRI